MNDSNRWLLTRAAALAAAAARRPSLRNQAAALVEGDATV
jgi:hypothetical protein